MVKVWDENRLRPATRYAWLDVPISRSPYLSSLTSPAAAIHWPTVPPVLVRIAPRPELLLLDSVDRSHEAPVPP